MSRGILYLATGEDFVEEAKYSASSAKEVMPDVPITIITNKTTNSEVFDNVLDLKDPRHDGGDRVSHMLRSPYDRTLFIDTDIYFAEAIHELFDLLDEFDIGAATNGQFFKSLEQHGKEIPTAFPEFNTGVLLYKNNQPVQKLHQLWETEFKTDTEGGVVHNQPSFRKALYKSNVRYTILPRRYNCIFRRPGHVHRKVKIFHGRLLDLDSYGADSLLDVEIAMKNINDRSGNRVYYPSGPSINTKPSIADRIRNSITHNGLLRTIGKIKNHI